MKRQRGVALILVLMVTGVLSLLMLQIGLTVAEQTSRAQRLIERAESDLRLASTNSALLFALLTHPWGPDSSVISDDPYAVNWNFRGKTFTVDGVEVSIQDLSGLNTLPQPGAGEGLLAQMLGAIGVPRDRAALAARQLAATQSPPELIPVQDFYELRLVAGLTVEETAALRRSATLFPTRAFNPATAPVDALAARFSGSAMQGLETLRERGALDDSAYSRLLDNGGDEFVNFYPGPGFVISTRVSSGVVTAAEELTLTIDPYATEPLVVWSRRRPAGGSIGR
jgi:hypothetical protein